MRILDDKNEKVEEKHPNFSDFCNNLHFIIEELKQTKNGDLGLAIFMESLTWFWYFFLSITFIKRDRPRLHSNYISKQKVHMMKVCQKLKSRNIYYITCTFGTWNNCRKFSSLKNEQSNGQYLSYLAFRILSENQKEMSKH